jgi:hypothetical protein
MTIDADKLRALLKNTKKPHSTVGDQALSLLDFAQAAVNALPELLAVYEAACAWRDEPPIAGVRFNSRLETAIDAARGKR